MPMTLLPAIHGCRARIARSGTASQAHIIRGSLMTGLALFVFGSLPVAAGMSKLNALEVARRGREFMSKKGDKSLGRGLVSLALHLDPFVYQEQEFVGWLPALLQSEPLNYCRVTLPAGTLVSRQKYQLFGAHRVAEFAAHWLILLRH